MKARSLSHTAITVVNFDRFVQFYAEHFGCRLVGGGDDELDRDVDGEVTAGAAAEVGPALLVRQQLGRSRRQSAELGSAAQESSRPVRLAQRIRQVSAQMRQIEQAAIDSGATRVSLQLTVG